MVEGRDGVTPSLKLFSKPSLFGVDLVSCYKIKEKLRDIVTKTCTVGT